MKKKLFKKYLLGYLNEYHLNNFYLNNKKNNNYKKFKTTKVSHYLNIPIRLLRVLISFIAFFEIPISLCLLSIISMKYIFMNLITPSKRVTHKKLMFGWYKDQFYFKNLMSSCGINLDDLTIIKLPSINAKYVDCKSISIFSGIDFRHILKAYFYSFQMIFFIKKKYGNRDFIFRAYSSFEYFLCYFFIDRSHINNIYYFDALIDRWAYLHGELKHKTIFIQHGIVNEKIKIKKIGKADYAYYINDKEKEICEKILFNNNPSFSYMKHGDFKPNSNKLIKNLSKNILLICNMLFYEKEKEIIKSFSKTKLNLYVKPHPNSIDEPYKNLTLEKNLVLLEKDDLPLVDVVISYHSTLAISYKNYGIEVLFYDDGLFQNKLENLLNINE